MAPTLSKIAMIRRRFRDNRNVNSDDDHLNQQLESLSSSSSPPNLHTIPDIPLLKIFSYLTKRELLSFGSVCQRLRWARDRTLCNRFHSIFICSNDIDEPLDRGGAHIYPIGITGPPLKPTIPKSSNEQQQFDLTIQYDHLTAVELDKKIQRNIDAINGVVFPSRPPPVGEMVMPLFYYERNRIANHNNNANKNKKTKLSTYISNNILSRNKIYVPRFVTGSSSSLFDLHVCSMEDLAQLGARFGTLIKSLHLIDDCKLQNSLLNILKYIGPNLTHLTVQFNRRLHQSWPILKHHIRNCLPSLQYLSVEINLLHLVELLLDNNDDYGYACGGGGDYQNQNHIKPQSSSSLCLPYLQELFFLYSIPSCEEQKTRSNTNVEPLAQMLNRLIQRRPTIRRLGIRILSLSSPHSLSSPSSSTLIEQLATSVNSWSSQVFERLDRLMICVPFSVATLESLCSSLACAPLRSLSITIGDNDRPFNLLHYLQPLAKLCNKSNSKLTELVLTINSNCSNDISVLLASQVNSIVVHQIDHPHQNDSKTTTTLLPRFPSVQTVNIHWNGATIDPHTTSWMVDAFPSAHTIRLHIYYLCLRQSLQDYFDGCDVCYQWNVLLSTRFYFNFIRMGRLALNYNNNGDSSKKRRLTIVADGL